MHSTTFRWLWLVLICLLVIACGAPAPTLTAAPATQALPTTLPPQPEVATPKAAQNKIPAATLFPVAWDDTGVFGPALLPAEASAGLALLPNASVYLIRLQLDDGYTSGKLRQEVRYVNNEDVALDAVYFRLYPNLFGDYLRPSAATLNGQTVQFELTAANSAVRLPLAAPLAPGAQVVATLDVDVTIPTSGGNYNTYAYAGGVLALAQFYPLIPLYDRLGWHTEIPPRYGDVTSADAAFYLVQVEAPEALKLVSSGVQTAATASKGRQAVTWVAGPVREFYLVGGEALEKSSQPAGKVTVNSYSLPGDAAGRALALETAANAIQIFGKDFGAYPYPEMDVVATDTQALGVEYPGITAITRRIYDPAGEINGAPQRVYLETTVAHEVAHQWFYALVGNDQTYEPWLDEALAQYATGVYYRQRYGESAAAEYRQSWQQRLENASRSDLPIGMPVEAYSDRDYSAIVYGRGPIFIAALEQRMTPQTFASFLRNYNRNYRWRVAYAGNFKSMAEAECGCDLTPEFRQWVMQP